jgi:hypothetical protein
MRSLLASGIVVASLTLAGNGAMAASAHVHHSAHVTHVAHARAAVHVAARRYQPRAQLDAGIAQFIQSMFGGGWPVQYSGLVRGAVASTSHQSAGSYDSSPSYDTSSPTTVDTSASDQAASDAEVQAIQSMNDTNALNASMAAAEQQNDAANAATLQTEINAGM